MEALKFDRHMTEYFIVASIAVAFAWDHFAVARWGPAASITCALRYCFNKHPILFFAFAFWVGHIVWKS